MPQVANIDNREWRKWGFELFHGGLCIDICLLTKSKMEVGDGWEGSLNQTYGALMLTMSTHIDESYSTNILHQAVSESA